MEKFFLMRLGGVIVLFSDAEVLSTTEDDNILSYVFRTYPGRCPGEGEVVEIAPSAAVAIHGEILYRNGIAEGAAHASRLVRDLDSSEE